MLLLAVHSYIICMNNFKFHDCFKFAVTTSCMLQGIWSWPTLSFVTSPHTPPGEKRSGKQSQISWAYYPKVVRTNEIVRSVHCPYNSKICHLYLSIRPFFEQVCKRFWTLLGYNVAKACASPRDSTWFTRPFLLVRGWGLGMRLTCSTCSVITVWHVTGLHSYIRLVHSHTCIQHAYTVVIIGIDAEMSEEFRIFQMTRKFVYIRHETCIMKCNAQSHGCTV